eukprot:CAMPEP_0171498412 /NCGR_PEP_ID=MMETSP0958-20121227/7836_1 /TAXON_ID=87120 /ORGANISM="Aurantiochytrium limacinum, Strain ATCCMYA-1381" /LENGTH=78 /DNA_ID=CAMNT_0012032809 /DNA_START=434 /DNA_END=670 /DNA_ORIENTATION=-
MAPQDPPSCGGSSSGQQGAPGATAGSSSGSNATPQQQQSQGAQGEVHEVFGDVNLGAAMLFLMLLHLLKYTMQDPCSC